jgi:uncharacterized membrane protein YhaH (DUF805 family)
MPPSQPTQPDPLDWTYLFTSFDGRISRRPFWIAFLTLMVAEIAVLTVAYWIEGDRLGAIVDLAFNYPAFALFTKRGHDRDMPTWLVAIFFAMAVLMNFLAVLGWSGRMAEPTPAMLIILVPWVLFSIALLIELGFRRGTQGPNRYGPDPLQ